MIEIRQTALAEIFHDPGFDALTDAYEAECGDREVGPKNLQEGLYVAMEVAGSLRCFGVWKTVYSSQFSVLSELVGYAFLLIYILPHYGVKIATTESIFVSQNVRRSGAGTTFKAFLRRYAKAEGCQEFLSSARAGSRYEKVLSRTKNCKRMSVVYRERLA